MGVNRWIEVHYGNVFGWSNATFPRFFFDICVVFVQKNPIPGVSYIFM